MLYCTVGLLEVFFGFFFSSRRRHTRCALVTGVQTCALPISGSAENRRALWADGLACDLAARVEDAEQHRGTKPLPEEPINLASDAGTTQRVRGRRAYVDRYAASRDGERPHREQAILEIGRASCRERVCQYV